MYAGSSPARVAAAPRTLATQPSYTACPYSEKDDAKSWGARWDQARKSWYVPAGVSLEPFERWMPMGPDAFSPGRAAAVAGAGAVAAPDAGRTYLHVHFCEKDDARAGRQV
jgi:hypothetical protein